MKRFLNRRLFFITAGIILAFIFSICLDKFLGYYLNKTGYFKAMTPNITEIGDSFEFNITSKISSQGIRNKEVIVPKPKGVYRVLAIGDSFTYGWGLDAEQTWINLLENDLQKSLSKGKQIEIINAGKPGAAPTDIRQICRAYADWFDIDAFIYASFADDIAQAAGKTLDQEATPVKTFLQNIWPILTRLHQRTIGFQRWGNIKPGSTIIHSEYNKKIVQRNVDHDPRLIININPDLRDVLISGRMNPALRIGAVISPDYYVYYLDPAKFNFALFEYKWRLNKIKEICTKDKPVIFVFIPTSHLISEYYLPFYQNLGYNIDKSLLNFDLDYYLKPIVKNAGFTYVSSLGPFREDGCKDCYYPYDGHLTPQGSKRLLDVIEPEVKSKLLSL